METIDPIGFLPYTVNRTKGGGDVELLWTRLDGRSGHEAGRALLQALYARAAGGPMPAIAVTDRGKPYFPGSPWHFSISHCRNHAFCCISTRNVGLDAEETDRAFRPEAVERYLSPGELARVRASADPRDALLRLWVLKEAAAKLSGRGIGSALRYTDFSPEDPRIRRIDGCYAAILEDEHDAF